MSILTSLHPFEDLRFRSRPVKVTHAFGLRDLHVQVINLRQNRKKKKLSDERTRTTRVETRVAIRTRTMKDSRR
jgi:hypothetical protein